ncbi:MAG: M48 family metalloprotease, partial [Rubritepida sp.]|nr:M48 family metalloprotease [Rubritepida sp.]
MIRAIGLSTHVWNNAIRGTLLLAGFPVLLVVLSFGVSMVFSAGEGTVAEGFAHAWRTLPAFIGGAVLVSLIWFAIAWAANQKIIDAVSGARVVSRETDRRLWDLMETLCIARGETMPRLAVIDSEARNAFASGLDRRKGSITVTRGLVEALDDRELSAVLAHELTHIRNGDARLAVIAAVFTGVITLGFDLLLRRRGGGVADAGGTGADGTTWRGRRGSSGSSRDGGLNIAILAIGLVIIVLAGTLSVALRLALSRNREYLADAGSVQITGDADAMVTALRRIDGRAEMALPSQIQAMLLEHAAGTGGGGLWATHPPIEQRIAALVRLAGARDPGPLSEPAGPFAEGPVAKPQAAPPWGRNLPLPIPGLPPLVGPAAASLPVEPVPATPSADSFS